MLYWPEADLTNLLQNDPREGLECELAQRTGAKLTLARPFRDCDRTS